MGIRVFPRHPPHISTHKFPLQPDNSQLSIKAYGLLVNCDTA